jgi:hypothetical protein
VKVVIPVDDFCDNGDHTRFKLLTYSGSSNSFKQNHIQDLDILSKSLVVAGWLTGRTRCAVVSERKRPMVPMLGIILYIALASRRKA